VIKTLFWAATVSVVYGYLLFPVLVVVRAVLRPRPYHPGEITPRVSVLVAAYNEAAGIALKAENLLALDYPPDRIEIIVASDGSTDGTEGILRTWENDRFRVLALPRLGKNEALNAAVAASSGEILVFTDANSMFSPDAVKELVRPFADPSVGAAAGNQVYLAGPTPYGAAKGERRYWDFDRVMKQALSRAGSVTSSTGAIYAIRRSLFRPMPSGVNDDFINSLRVVADGYRHVFAEDARAYEPIAGSRQVEFGRKVRIMTRGLRCAVSIPRLFMPWRYGFFSLQLFSHKILMRLMAFPLLVIGLSSIALWSKGWIYRLAVIAQAGFYASGAAGLLLARSRVALSPAFAIPSYFCLVNAASLVAAWRVMRGDRVAQWDPERTGPPALGIGRAEPLGQEPREERSEVGRSS
jgi:glycosyltransferase involved in cell wall biosynthesis